MSTELCCNRRSTRPGGLAASGKLRSNNRRGQVSSLDRWIDKGVPILLHRKGGWCQDPLPLVIASTHHQRERFTPLSSEGRSIDHR